jgi:D-alanyl-D-alanine carboxypeptidase/D-alanyl-D-alanine-endopeptidase (penicillin-binding protein 4)
MFNSQFSMNKISLTFLFLLFSFISPAQSTKDKLIKAYQQFESDSQLRHAISSLYVINSKTGEVVFDRNSQIGLAPASTQKIIIAAAAFELLGKDYRYKTYFKKLGGDICVAGGGDPTLGSWRYPQTIDTVLFRTVLDFYKEKGVQKMRNIVLYEKEEIKNIPSTWIYEDIGNYYGAAAMDFNWHENQYNITFFPGKKEGDRTEIDTAEIWQWPLLINYCKTGKAGSGDNAYVYFLPEEKFSVIEGTVPAGVTTFTIAASDYKPNISFGISFIQYAVKQNFYLGNADEVNFKPLNNSADSMVINEADFIHYSPSLDSIIYWFLQKSINLYGEALIKTFAYEKKGFGSTDSGVNIVKDFWKQKGIDPGELNIKDGSGLSPQNRVTTHAQVEILKYAQQQSWFAYYYNAFPEYNGMKMKSGTISDAKGFCGYQKSSDGNEYIFSFLVNNYSGSIVNKMYKVLDVLK